MIERRIFEALKHHLQLEEPDRTPGSLRYSWDNFRDDGSHILARLDRCYISKNAGRRVLSYTTRGDSTWSDHAPVEVSLQLEAEHRQRSRWHMNSQYLDEASPPMIQIWNNLPIKTSLFSKIKMLTKYYRRYCKDKATQFQQLQVQEQLAIATDQLQTNPSDPTLQQRHGDCRQRLQQLELQVDAGKRVRSGIRWHFKGDMILKEFFKSVQEKSSATVITCLRSEEGSEVRDPAGLHRLGLEFYRKLLSIRTLTENQAARQEILETVQKKLSLDGKARLMAPLTLIELKDAA